MIDIEELFIDEPAPPRLVIIDRSTLERWADCPHAAHLIASGAVSNGGRMAEVGSAVHAIISGAVALRAEHAATPAQMREHIETEAQRSRPDIQPDVIAAMRRTYPLVMAICSQPDSGEPRAPEDLLRYDGGKGARSGQLAADFGGVRLTCEVDLLTSTPSPEEVDLWDWKSGWKHWTAMSVLASFQFNFYSYLVLRNYPKVNTVRVRVFMTRTGETTGVVVFRRERDMYPTGARIGQAVELYQRHAGEKSAEDVPAWPSPDKCRVCDAVLVCKVASEPEADVAREPEQAVRQLVVLDARLAHLRKALSAQVRARGEDYKFGDVCYGVGAPKGKPRATACKVYGTKAGAESAGEEEES